MKNTFFEQIRAEYVAMNERARAAGKTEPGLPILTASSLRLEQFITAANTLYTFPVLDGQVGGGSASVLPNEVRLQTNDNFHVEKLGFYLGITAASTDTAFRLQTYPNEVFLATAAAALNYLNVYNGTLNINVNQVDVLTKWRISKHMFVPQTQRLAATVNNNFDQVDLHTDALIPVSPSIMISGAYTNVITISLPAAVTSALSANNSRMVIIFDGLRAQNAAIRK